MAKTPRFTKLQQRFAAEYVIDFNGTQAVMRARAALGSKALSEAGAAVSASHFLRLPNVIEEIQRLEKAKIQRLEKKHDVTLDRVVAELAKIGFANMGDYMKGTSDGDPYMDFSSLTPEQTAALSEVTIDDYRDGRGEDARDVKRIKFKLHDKRAALVDLGKHLGMFPDKPLDPDGDKTIVIKGGLPNGD